MKQILSFAAMLALVLPLFISNAQEHPKSAKDKQCMTKTSKAGCCASKASKASNTHEGCAGKAKLMKASNKTDACSGKDKAACAEKCSHKEASTESKDAPN